MPDIIFRAAEFCCAAHDGQFRKYENPAEPYWHHPMRVAGRMLLDVANRALPLAVKEEQVAVAYLHDVLEDTSVSETELETLFGPGVLAGVKWLTNASKGSSLPRKERKDEDFLKLTFAPAYAKRIKLIDRTDNLASIQGAPEKFVGLYTQESKRLLELLEASSKELAGEFRIALNRVCPDPIRGSASLF